MLGPVHRRTDPTQGAGDDRPAAARGGHILPAERPALPQRRADRTRRPASSRRTTPTPTATRCCSAPPAPAACGSPTTMCRRRTRRAGMCSRGGSTMRSPSFCFFRARYYSSDSGRFVSRDMAYWTDDENLYQYVLGSPMSLVDPSGFGQGWSRGNRPAPPPKKVWTNVGSPIASAQTAVDEDRPAGTLHRLPR